jgi:hypothetical protein
MDKKFMVLSLKIFAFLLAVCKMNLCKYDRDIADKLSMEAYDLVYEIKETKEEL